MKNVLEGAPGFRASVEFRRQGVCVVAVTGEADGYAAPDLKERLDECCASPAVRQVIVDLTAASFLDSVALSVIVAANRALRRRSVPLKVICRDHNIRRLFAITGLDRLFSVFASTDEALATTSI